ncbi:hypothetical protein NQ315_013436 [Exocentrus adspersus]|uniref:Uncharacterized protein n=1 Tax=Exocentrus adspersus TaxID=1586481 RepID=A0AAV8VHC1_9CUCU|nr:hypothetical protein NQ315_013436 [Exocentrus adspersus]
MEYLTQKFQSLINIVVMRTKANSTARRKISRYAIYLDHIYEVLSWENVTLTLVTFLVLNFIFWAIVHWQLRLLGVLFSIILLEFIWGTYCEAKESTIHREQYADVLEDLHSLINDIILNLKALRKENPLSVSETSASECVSFSCLCLLSGRMFLDIFYSTLYYLEYFFVPLGVKYLPEEYYIKLKQIILKSIGTSTAVLAEEELIPFIFNKDFSRKDTDLDSLLTDRTADSVTNSLASGIGAMPSYLEVMESQSVIDEDDLLPKNMSQDGVSYTPGDLSSDSDSDHRGIQFDSAHFNGDSSSEEENLLIKGLKFMSKAPDLPENKMVSNVGLSGVLSNIATVSSTLVSNVIKSAVLNAPVERKNSSDSEFEIIDSEEIDSS